MSTTLQDLKQALKESLENTGSLAQMKARIRSEIFNCLDEQEESKPSLTHENLLINELIREYLDFNKYRHTLAVLVPESNMPVAPLDRHFLAQKLGIENDTDPRAVPLLYAILKMLTTAAELRELDQR
eukprot:gnl/Hemi2/3611_TR1255_c0_g1_i1.p1 gnl/Hemi2/3611_TR1255_c0_g1~~gnl/Hemi2/3611_TR1255_c0_g1_i1.p1  ORF type:complete len:128 (+),score=43.94 gnl/Hemi2/3611_TR1255_c0_g1_i1:85-468(+)